jgi:hypothetical protein
MNVKKLKELLINLPDDMKVLVPAQPTEGFTGHFFSPCEQDSQPIEMGGDENTTEEEIDRAENLGTLQSEKSFVLVPCGFYEEHDNSHELN